MKNIDISISIQIDEENLKMLNTETGEIIPYSQMEKIDKENYIISSIADCLENCEDYQSYDIDIQEYD